MNWDERDIRHALARLAQALSSGHHEIDEEDAQFVEDMIEEDQLSTVQLRRLHDISEAYEEWADEYDPDDQENADD